MPLAQENGKSNTVPDDKQDSQQPGLSGLGRTSSENAGISSESNDPTKKEETEEKPIEDEAMLAMDPVERDFRRELESIKRTGMTVSQHLIQLCRRGDWLAVDNLLRFLNDEEFDLDAVAQGTGWTPVMFAVKENRVNIVERLLDVGFDVNAQATVSVHFYSFQEYQKFNCKLLTNIVLLKDGITALHLACAYAREDTIRCLLVHKANPMLAGGVSI